MHMLMQNKVESLLHEKAILCTTSLKLWTYGITGFQTPKPPNYGPVYIALFKVLQRMPNCTRKITFLSISWHSSEIR